MTTFFIDLWQDLREKRLWPIAVGLVAATAAVPLLLFKPAGGDSEPGPAVASPASSASPLPALTVSAAPTQGSHLETFKQKDPFKPLKDLSNAQTGVTSAATTASTPSATKSSTPSPSSSGGSASGGSGSSASGGHASPTTGGGSGSSGSTVPHVTTQTTTQSWIYTATFSFGPPEKMKTMKDVTPFTLLPNDKNPVIVFASAGADGKSAIFYIQDPTFKPQGEGKCNAKGDKCHFVTLTLKDTGNEEAFVSTDGTQEFDVKLESINRKPISSLTSGGGATPTKGKAVAGAAKHEAKVSQSFLGLLLGFSTSTTRHEQKK